jgi:hypothetical protein
MNARATLALFDVLRAHAFIRGENTLAVVCDRLFDEVGASLEASVVANGFALLPVHEIDEMVEYSHAASVARVARLFEANLQRVLRGLQ